MNDICIRCTEDIIDDDPSYDASNYTQNLTAENIKHKPDDQLCINCANHYNRENWLKEATKGGPDVESHEQTEENTLCNNLQTKNA